MLMLQTFSRGWVGGQKSLVEDEQQQQNDRHSRPQPQQATYPIPSSVNHQLIGKPPPALRVRLARTAGIFQDSSPANLAQEHLRLAAEPGRNSFQSGFLRPHALPLGLKRRQAGADRIEQNRDRQRLLAQAVSQPSDHCFELIDLIPQLVGTGQRLAFNIIGRFGHKCRQPDYKS